MITFVSADKETVITGTLSYEQGREYLDGTIEKYPPSFFIVKSDRRLRVKTAKSGKKSIHVSLGDSGFKVVCYNSQFVEHYVEGP